MSVFRVSLQQSVQGNLDLDPTNPNTELSPSIQRTIYVTGPNNTYRKLYDGDIFTDCNYWKRFAYPQSSREQAFIEIITDDGSMYSDFSEENTYPKVYDLTVENGTSYSDPSNVADILTDTGGYAVFVQISNQGSTAVKCRLNGVADAIFDLGPSETQVFNNGDLSVTKLEFANVASGGSDTDVQVLVSVKSVCNS